MASQDQGDKQPKPPGYHAGQWKPGQSGNPGGRPKGKSLLAEIRDVLDGDELLGKKNPGGKTTRRLLAETALMHAIQGRSAYFKEILERLFGKVPLRVEQKSADDGDDGQSIPPHVVEAGLKAMLEAMSEDRGPES